MRIIAVLFILVLSSCAEPMQNVEVAVKACIDLGKTPQYFHNGMKTEFTCE